MALNAKWRSELTGVTKLTVKPVQIPGTKYRAIRINGLKFIKNVSVMTKADRNQEINYLSKKVVDLTWEVDNKQNGYKAINTDQIQARVDKINLMQAQINLLDAPKSK